MDTDDPVEQENTCSTDKKPLPQSGIELDVIHGLLDSYSTSETKVKGYRIMIYLY